MKEDHYERLSCTHQNNLLLHGQNGLIRESGVCPKGCKDIEVLRIVQREKPTGD